MKSKGGRSRELSLLDVDDAVWDAVWENITLAVVESTTPLVGVMVPLCDEEGVVELILLVSV